MRGRVHFYQPCLEERNLRRLYRLKVWFREQSGRRMPMTVLLNRILDDFFILFESPADAPPWLASSRIRRTP
ncbi:MAG: hypothetical protein KJ062_11435 [Thermoanaerobaculia bacterium]|nr:hypothetical protein [Thermoanaerobaculia bacterium]